jgi:predicted nucleic acid-binding protein
MRVFLDANILFSAAKTRGAIRQLLDLLLEAGHILVADPYVIAEAERNIRSRYPESLPDLQGLLMAVGRQPAAGRSALQAAESVNLDPKDRPVLAAAIAAGCDILVTGDTTHFGELYGRTVRNVTVLSSRQAAERLCPGACRDKGR